MYKKIAVAFLALSLIPVIALADGKPTPQEVKKVLDYYYRGKGLGPVLSEVRVCRDIQREGDEKNECAGEFGSEPVKKGDSVYLWMAFMVPTGDEAQNIIVQFDNGGVTRMVKNLQASGSLRYRTWLKLTFDKTGPWNVKIVHDKGDGTDVLGTQDIVVE
jgi:hypothetical protein